jgi:carbon-monoxide dehydrogenase small subunit
LEIMIETAIKLNGREVRASVPPRTSLADFIREHAGLTGTHLGCEHGICGACTVEVDGEITRSCITLAVACDGASVRTIEGFDSDPLMESLRKAFTEEHALQCGYCTPGMLIAARDLIRRSEARTVPAIRAAMSGNLCRCTGYSGIIAAVKRVSDEAATGAFADSMRVEGAPLGPAGSNASDIVRDRISAGEPAEKHAPPPPHPVSLQKPRRIEVTTKILGEAEGMTTLSQSFLLPHPLQAVWARFRNPDSLVTSLPGASLDSMDGGGAFSATIKVVFGPISAVFQGSGTFTASESDYSGFIRGAGQDQRGGTKAQGEMRFQLAAVSAGETLVDAKISYRLTGALAQFGRPGAVRSIVAEIGAIFASNIDRAISGGSPGSAEGARLRGGLLLYGILKAWVTAFWRRVSARR